MSDQLQETILANLVQNDSYMRKVIPFIKDDYFVGTYKKIFSQICKHVAKYNKMPTKTSFVIESVDNDAYNDDDYDTLNTSIDFLFDQRDADQEWLLDTTEKWCQDRALFNAVMESMTIIDGKHKTLSKNALPDILQKALSVTFDTNVGHDYLDNVEERYEFYHEQEERIPFDLEMFNLITKGGLVRKTLNMILAGTGVGKSLAMCHMAGSNLSMGYNVLYVTGEMSEERIAERIDANMLNVPIDQLENLSKEMLKDRVAAIAAKTKGKLIIKEYPTSTANANHIRALLNELKLKKNFVPDVIYIDYLNIFASARMKGLGGSINTYSYIKAIAEEFRGLAVEFDVPIVSATQTTRSGFANSDPGLEDTSESFGLPATADLFVAAISNDELVSMGQIMFKQLKNRYADTNNHKRFFVGIDRTKMQLFDVSQDEHEVVDDTPVFDNSNAGEKISQELRFDP